MKRIILLLLAGAAAVSCQNKELGEGINNTSPVTIEFDWEGVEASQIPTAYGMRVNIFSIESNIRNYGVDDLGYAGGTVKLVKGARYRTIAYSYRGNNIYFRRETDQDMIEAYCNLLSRATYSRAFPEETTYTEPQGLFYTGEAPNVMIRPDEVITIHPTSKVYTYTFEVRGITGAEFISDTRGAISGMSSSYYIGTNQRSQTPTTVLFNARADKENNRIVGSFKTFGRVDRDNHFSIEILYPSGTNGIVMYTWNVTPQIGDETNYHIIIDDSGIVIPDEGGESASGWLVDVEAWKDTDVDLN